MKSRSWWLGVSPGVSPSQRWSGASMTRMTDAVGLYGQEPGRSEEATMSRLDLEAEAARQPQGGGPAPSRSGRWRACRRATLRTAGWRTSRSAPAPGRRPCLLGPGRASLGPGRAVGRHVEGVDARAGQVAAPRRRRRSAPGRCSPGALQGFRPIAGVSQTLPSGAARRNRGTWKPQPMAGTPSSFV